MTAAVRIICWKIVEQQLPSKLGKSEEQSRRQEVLLARSTAAVSRC
jgi:hypothetical protein